MESIFGKIQEIVSEGRPAALATIVECRGSTPRKPGARMIVYPNGTIDGTIGGGALEKQAIEEALQVLAEGAPKLIRIVLHDDVPGSGVGICGGEASVFLERIGSAPRLLIFGAGHVGRMLARMAEEFDFTIAVFDDRREFADPALFSPRVKVHCAPFGQAIELLKPTPEDYIVIMTYGHEHDGQLLRDALKTPAKYVGMIGSRKKCLKIKEDLVKEGFTPQQIERAAAPIGLPIGAHTPAEIAVSILAQLIQVANGLSPDGED
ncbi:MAG: XdhC/CoxI family protein [Candidatus Omnitrophota bacterium]